MHANQPESIVSVKAQMTERLAALTLHPDKTRFIEFGRHAASDRERRGQGKLETFAFLEWESSNPT